MKKTIFIIIVSVILALLLSVVLSGYLSARLATWPALRDLNIFHPQAPIVITNREEIRVSDTQDALEAVNRVKSRLASVAILQNNQLVITGGAISLTADGYFATAARAFQTPGTAYFAVTNDGSVIPIERLFTDPATSLAVFRAGRNSASVAALANSARLGPGQKMIIVSSGAISSSARFLETHVTAAQGDSHAVANADRPSRTFGIQEVGTLIPGQPIVTLAGEIAGLWDGQAIISSDVIQTTTNLFFGSNLSLPRPHFGFSHRLIALAESTALSLPQGAVVSAVLANSPAQTAGLAEGDIIIQFNDTRINESSLLEPLLERVKPGEQIRLIVVRNRVQVNLTLQAGELN